MAGRQVALTFEAGGSPEPTPAILDTLADWSCRATFFVDGRWAEAHADLLARVAADGHELGTHGYAHPDWTTLPDDEIVDDLRETEALVERLLGRAPRPWARPPYGAVDDRVAGVLAGAGYRILYRDAVDGAHWPGETTDAAVRARALAAATSDGVVVFHTNSDVTARVLPFVLADLEVHRLQPVRLSDLEPPPPPRSPRHADFDDLAIRPGHLVAHAAGRWSQLNVLERGAAAARVPGAAEVVADLGDVSLEVVTGGADAFEPVLDPSDRYVLVLAGELTCEFGDETARMLARPGDLFLCPAGVRHRLGPSPLGTRWIAAVWKR